MERWKYFGRTCGGATVFEICRYPDNGKDIDNQDWRKYPEWLQPDGSWQFYPDDETIHRERINGNFDEVIDELSEEQVNEFYSSWARSRWPGRVRVYED